MRAKYSGSLTGEPYMLYETKIVADLMLHDFNKEQIKDKVLESNPFGYKTKKSIPKRLNAIFRRLKPLNNNLLRFIVEDLSGDGKIVVVYAIALEHKLFQELVLENISYHISIRDFRYSKKDVYKFVDNKSSNSKKLDGFSDGTKRKLVNVMFNILKESGIIQEKENYYYIKPIMVSADLQKLFKRENKELFLQKLGVSI